ncbi:MAG: 4Fe-4S dicluster domain-containing protein [Kofleriaceae bacterium]|nr:MAG: 4Fe-4S dicluster domain-containing protein [Kofleriaceae bacterium]MBZ0234801.1 4Fe-4S dicluster domain-containing protein [Kofleriaceae bacterium]
MPKVKNWHLGREAEYPYDDHRPAKQWAIVFDLNKCIACQTCTLACKTTWTSGKGQEYMFWNNVETKPWGGYPLAWDLRILEKLGRQEWGASGEYLGKTIYEAAPSNERALHFAPTDEDWMYPNIGEDDCGGGNVDGGAHMGELPHDKWFFYLPRTCAHCTYPACLAACPRKAIYKREEDGIVLIDQSRCKGYGECVRACPYKKSMYNPYTRVSEKCIGCYPAVEQGYQPQCVVNCIGKIRVMGFINPPGKTRRDNPVDYLVHEKGLALPYYPQLGTEPNIYYIPPIHADRDYLHQMFGPRVDDAIAAYQALPDDPRASGLLCLIGSTDRIIHRFDVKGGTAFGYDDKGAELVRVPVTEKLIERTAFDARIGAVRNNTP